MGSRTIIPTGRLYSRCQRDAVCRQGVSPTNICGWEARYNLAFAMGRIVLASRIGGESYNYIALA